ncbi:hypothetical protein SAMN04488127_1772 [Bhargavaea ginsengi]|uniref:Fe-S cluster assembly iron-binding protein IscA n=1 Tax=Bhargavaea ginsengi TaxID=426757 RepID=A0A1H6YRC0_9BACL|nr:Fe-S cluster assembly protein HesB [Bhargavaea ginsengi]SEJ43833.1 hypothetical protein SAMN04488127_1772 [Bhargavaea ginsengi]
MNVSPEGKAFLTEVQAKQPDKSIRFYGVPGCCGVNMGAELAVPADGDEQVELEGIRFAVDPQVKAMLADVTVHAEENEGEMGLMLVGYQPGSC